MKMGLCFITKKKTFSMRNLFDTYKQHYKALLLLGLPIVVGQLGVIVLGLPIR